MATDRRATTRRRFLQALGSTSLMPLLSYAAPDAPPPDTAPAPVHPADQDEALVAEARGLVDILERRFAGRFDDAALHALRSDVEGVLRDARALRAVELRNADEPAVIFRTLPLAE
jgi:hypothetical protein